MVLFVGTTAQYEHVYYVQDNMTTPVEEIQYVMADCTELEAIQSCVTGIPMIKGAKINEWYGDDAKFIAANWVRIVKMWRNK